MTLKVAVPPTATVWLTGWVMMVGGELLLVTVRRALLLVSGVAPQASVIVT